MLKSQSPKNNNIKVIFNMIQCNCSPGNIYRRINITFVRMDSLLYLKWNSSVLHINLLTGQFFVKIKFLPVPNAVIRSFR